MDGKTFAVLSKIPSVAIIAAIEFSPDGSSLATLDIKGNINVYSLNGLSLKLPALKTLKTTTVGQDAKMSLSFTTNHLIAHCGTDFIASYDRTNWNEAPLVNSHGSKSLTDETFFAFPLNDQVLVRAAVGGIRLISLVRNEEFYRLKSKKLSYSLIGKSKEVELDIEEKGSYSLCAASAEKLIIYDNKTSMLLSFNVIINNDDVQIPAEEPEPISKKEKIIKAEPQKSIKSESKKTSKKAIVSDDEESATIGDAEFDKETPYIGSEVEYDGMSMASEADAGDDVGDEEEPFDFPAPLKKHQLIQPGRTPWRNLQRYLGYNCVGFITARRDTDNLILYNYDIEFTDRSLHKPVRFSDEVGYEAATLNENGAIFASQFKVHYISFHDSQQSWTIEMVPNSVPVLVALSRDYCYVLLSRGILNIYTQSGLLQASVCCPAQPVSLLAFEEELVFFGQDFAGVSCYRLDAPTGTQLSCSRVMVDETDALIWSGYNEAGLLAAFTQNGRMLLRLTEGGDRWTEILNTAIIPDVKLVWPVYFDVTSLSAVRCNHDEIFPDPYPAPHVTEIPLQIPEISPDLIETGFEESLRTRLILRETGICDKNVISEKERKKMEMAADRHLLEMAQISVKFGRFGRVIELAKMASSEKTLDLLIQLARHHKLVAIVDALERIRYPINKVSAVAEVVKDVIKEVETTISLPAEEASTPAKPIQKCESESPATLLGSLTPIKNANAPEIIEEEPVSSSLAPSPANPFAKNEPAEPSVMLDYISTLMKMSSKRKVDENDAATANKRPNAQ